MAFPCMTELIRACQGCSTHQRFQTHSCMHQHHVAAECISAFRYDKLMEAFHGSGYHVSTAKQLQAATRKAFEARKPAVLNVILDPYAGVESGNVHSFNAPKSNL